MANNYEEVDVLRDPDGVAAVITRKLDTGYLSFSIMKEFERDGQILRTTFLNRRHMAAVKRLIARVEEYIDAEVERATSRRVTGPQAVGRGGRP